MRTISLLAILLFIAIAITACASAPAADPAPQTVPAVDGRPEPAKTDDGTAPGDSAQQVEEFQVRAFQYGFEPETITVKEGSLVRITYTSDDVAHGVSIPDFGVRTEEFGKGDSVTVEFTADKAGTFPYRCSVFCGDGHREMEGQIIVEE